MGNTVKGSQGRLLGLLCVRVFLAATHYSSDLSIMLRPLLNKTPFDFHINYSCLFLQAMRILYLPKQSVKYNYFTQYLYLYA